MCRNSPDGELPYQDIMEIPYLDAVIADKVINYNLFFVNIYIIIAFL